MEDRGSVGLALGPRRVQRGRPRGQGEGRLLTAEARIRRAPGPARPGDRVRRPQAHLHGHGGGPPRGGGGRPPDPARGPEDRRVTLLRPRRAVREHDRLRSSDHPPPDRDRGGDRKSTRLNSSHITISYAVFCLKKKKKKKKKNKKKNKKKEESNK